MMYNLDTNACIRYLNGRAPGVRARLQALKPEDVTVSSIVKAELFAGALRSTNPARTLERQQEFLAQFVSLPFDDAAAEVYGRIRAALEEIGTPIGPYDLQIASIAIAHDLILVTRNTREFGRVSGLRLEDWEA